MTRPGQAFKNIKRLNQILVTLIRYGFGGIAAELRIFPLFAALERVFVSKKLVKDLPIPVRIRLVLEELGPTFVKLGQIASTRADLLPPDWINEFKKLQDMVPPFPFEDARKVVEKSLNAPIPAKFATFDEVPVASASIAQVHYATLLDGTPVAVKIKRPGIERIIESDLSVMHTIAQLLEKYIPASRRYRPQEVVNEFARVITNEQNLSIEGVNINRFYNIFKNESTIQIPHVYWDYTTEDVLTMERISGTPIDETDKIKAKGLDVKKIAHNGIELFFKQVFEHGIFHGDLHPGNIFVRDDGVLIYLDFGIVGRLDRNLRKYLASILFHLVRGDYYKMALVHRDMGLIGPGVDLHEFEEAIRDISEPIFGRTLEQINISALLMKLIQTARRFDMVLQPNLLLLQKSMVIIEGVGRQLYPDVNMWEVAKPLIYRWMIRERYSPKAVIEKCREQSEEIFDSIIELPGQVHKLLDRALKNELNIGFVNRRTDEVTEEIDRASRRIAGGVITGSLILGSFVAAIFIEGGIKLFGFPILSIAGFLLSIYLGLRFFRKRPEPAKKITDYLK